MMEKYDIAYEVDHYEVIFDNGEKHIFIFEENAVRYMEQNKERNPRFMKILNGILVGGVGFNIDPKNYNISNRIKSMEGRI